jgi:hypothetical protein
LLTTTKNLDVVDFEQESEAFLINKRLLDNSNTTERYLLSFRVQNVSFLLKHALGYIMYYIIIALTESEIVTSIVYRGCFPNPTGYHNSSAPGKKLNLARALPEPTFILLSERITECCAFFSVTDANPPGPFSDSVKSTVTRTSKASDTSLLMSTSVR